MSVTVHKAEPVRSGEIPPSGAVQVNEQLPSGADERQRAMITDALKIHHELLASLPGATLDELRVLLVRGAASQLVVRDRLWSTSFVAWWEANRGRFGDVSTYSDKAHELAHDAYLCGREAMRQEALRIMGGLDVSPAWMEKAKAACRMLVKAYAGEGPAECGSIEMAHEYAADAVSEMDGE